MTPPLPLLTIVLTLLSLGVLQGLITSVIIWFKKSPLLALWIGMFSLEISQKILFVNNIAPGITQWIGGWFTFDFLYGPLMYLWVYQLIHSKINWKVQWIHGIPVMAYLAMKLPGLMALTHIERLSMIQPFLEGGSWQSPATLFDSFHHYIMLYPFIYSVATLYRLLQHRILFNRDHSKGLEIRYDWLLYMVIFQIIMWLAAMAIVSKPYVDPVIQWLASYLPAMIWINLLAWLSLFYQPFVSQQQERQTKFDGGLTDNPPLNTDKYARNKINSSTRQAIVDALAVQEQEGLFKQSKLTLQELADTLDIPSHWVSQVINDHLNSNFFDYINRLRVGAVQKQLEDPNDQRTILDIALSNGFNSKSTFNTVFKKYTEVTPRQYRLNQLNEM